MKIFNKCLAISLMACSATISVIALADDLDFATQEDISSLCQNLESHSLFDIANNQNLSEEARREALERTSEVAQECSDAEDDQLQIYHGDMISAAYSFLHLSIIDTRQVAIDIIEYVILQPEATQPAAEVDLLADKLSTVALNDSEVEIRLWALETLVMLRGDSFIVKDTLDDVIGNDTAQIVIQAATEMRADFVENAPDSSSDLQKALENLRRLSTLSGNNTFPSNNNSPLLDFMGELMNNNMGGGFAEPIDDRMLTDLSDLTNSPDLPNFPDTTNMSNPFDQPNTSGNGSDLMNILGNLNALSDDEPEEDSVFGSIFSNSIFNGFF